MTRSEILNGDFVREHGIDIPTFIIGDSAYPLNTWLMKPFTYSTNLSPAKKSFNNHLSSAHVVAENAFGRLKARFRRLCKRNDMHIDNVSRAVTACCILHNMCEIHGDSVNDLWLEQADNITYNQLTSKTTCWWQY